MNSSPDNFADTAQLLPNETFYEDPYMMPWWSQLIFLTAFVILITVALGGNLIVIWIVMAHKRMRTVTNYFLVNLAVADTLISLLNTPFISVFLLYQNWWFGDLWCKFANFVAICTVSASVLTLMAIAIDRYMAIIHPLRPRVTGRVIVAIIVIWIASTVLSFPNLIYSTTVNFNYTEICTFEWPDGNSTNSRIDFWYNIIILLATYLIPMATLTVTYTRIGVELWGQQTIGENTPVQFERMKSKRRVVKMMVMVIIIFGICWLPYHLYFVLVSTTNITRMKYIQEFYLVIYWLAMSNSMYNPIIYCWMNAKFRQGFVRAFCCCPCAPCKRIRTRMYHVRALYPAGQFTMSEKFYHRNGSSMHTVTEDMDDTSSSLVRKSIKHNPHKLVD
ncbi:tachykinin-like peptides receptor 99D [Mytilus californianus]|uniref:tachykinin-like peptides receptor 99D n=1 Tax=Mytilus californianus TaxID=6549 RepID=UPI0022450B02|nr:tachykinin-like peptides receptor 99D [Mytilus californianus]